MSNLDESINFDGFYIEANLSEDCQEVEILANELGLRYLKALIEKLIASNLDGKHCHLDTVTGLEGSIRSIVLTRASPHGYV